MDCTKLNKRKINYIIRAKNKRTELQADWKGLKNKCINSEKGMIHWLNYGEPIEIKRSGRKMLNIDEKIEKIILSVHNKQKL